MRKSTKIICGCITLAILCGLLMWGGVWFFSSGWDSPDVEKDSQLSPQATREAWKNILTLENTDDIRTTSVNLFCYAGDKNLTCRMRRLGSSAAPLFIETLREDADSYNRMLAAYALWTLQPPPPEALGALIEALDDEENAVQAWAAFAIANYGPSVADEAIPALIRKYERNEDVVDRAALLAIAQLGPSAEKAMPAIVRNLKKWDHLHSYYPWPVRLYYPWVDQAATEEMLKEINSNKEHIRKLEQKGLMKETIQNLGIFGPYAAEAVPELIRALDDAEVSFQISAAKTLGYIGPKASAALPKLEELSKSSNEELRKIAARAISNIKNYVPVRYQGPPDSVWRTWPYQKVDSKVGEAE